MNPDGLHHVTAGASPPAHFRHKENARKLLSAEYDAISDWRYCPDGVDPLQYIRAKSDT
jgi:hypothetical protein